MSARRKREFIFLCCRFTVSADRLPLRPFASLNSRRGCPTKIWRGRAIFCSGSVIISCHCASQPTVRGIANITGNIATGKPIA